MAVPGPVECEIGVQNKDTHHEQGGRPGPGRQRVGWGVGCRAVGSCVWGEGPGCGGPGGVGGGGGAPSTCLSQAEMCNALCGNETVWQVLVACVW